MEIEPEKLRDTILSRDHVLCIDAVLRQVKSARILYQCEKSKQLREGTGMQRTCFTVKQVVKFSEWFVFPGELRGCFESFAGQHSLQIPLALSLNADKKLTICKCFPSNSKDGSPEKASGSSRYLLLKQFSLSNVAVTQNF